MKHTPGPWSVNYACIVEAPRKFRHNLAICAVNGNSVEEGEANAKLIAAAPELLAVLKWTSEELYQRGYLGYEELCEKIDLITEKAEGLTDEQTDK